MATKHLPGPWDLVEHEHEPAEIRSPETGLGIAHVFCTDHDFGKANAALIAAAPDLLEAAKCALAALSQNATFPADIALAKKALSAAIAKVA